jgi:hypothetical protein
MVVPFWELQHDDHETSRGAIMEHSINEGRRCFASKRKWNGTTAAEEKRTIPIVQRRNLTYIKLTKTIIRSKVIKPAG